MECYRMRFVAIALSVSSGLALLNGVAGAAYGGDEAVLSANSEAWTGRTQFAQRTLNCDACPGPACPAACYGDKPNSGDKDTKQHLYETYFRDICEKQKSC